MAAFENPIQHSHAPGTHDYLHQALRGELLQRRQKLEQATLELEDTQLVRLLHDVDVALGRLETGVYGVCDFCGEAVENQRLLSDPLVRFCLEHLPPEQQRALERDLELAAQIQTRLLPPPDLRRNGWHVAYHYQPLGMVSGDYCDLLEGPNGDLYFILGDVSGKGIAASLLMSNLNAMFRALVPLDISLPQLMEHANRVFSESTLPTQYATLVAGRATHDGEVEICNAGHLPGLVAVGDTVTQVKSNALPIGLFTDKKFSTRSFRLAPRDFMVLFY